MGIALSLSRDKILQRRSSENYPVSYLDFFAKLVALIHCSLNLLQLHWLPVVLLYLVHQLLLDVSEKLLVPCHLTLMYVVDPWLYFWEHLINVVKVTLRLDNLKVGH